MDQVGIRRSPHGTSLNDLVFTYTGINPLSFNPIWQSALTHETLDSSANLIGSPKSAFRAVSLAHSHFSDIFRDEEFWIYLNRTIAHLHARIGKDVKVLSLGCSGGLEAFSIGLLLEQSHLFQSIDITGIDIDPSSIVQARRNLRNYNRLGHSSLVTSKYSDIFQAEIRDSEAVTTYRFRCEDILEAESSEQYDIVLCRYVRNNIPRSILDDFYICLASWATGSTIFALENQVFIANEDKTELVHHKYFDIS